MDINIKGTVTEIGNVVYHKTNDNYNRVSFCIEAQEGRFKNEYEFTAYGLACEDVTNLFVGANVDVTFYIRTNKKGDKRFTTLVAKNIIILNE
jgi:hypothetical protein